MDKPRLEIYIDPKYNELFVKCPFCLKGLEEGAESSNTLVLEEYSIKNCSECSELWYMNREQWESLKDIEGTDSIDKYNRRFYIDLHFITDIKLDRILPLGSDVKIPMDQIEYLLKYDMEIYGDNPYENIIKDFNDKFYNGSPQLYLDDENCTGEDDETNDMNVSLPVNTYTPLEATRRSVHYRSLRESYHIFCKAEGVDKAELYFCDWWK